ncbi:Global transcription regulator sge1 [Massospora cicadina]|nr:Global transcription regulator sge1 [Massospora cicadina]
MITLRGLKRLEGGIKCSIVFKASVTMDAVMQRFTGVIETVFDAFVIAELAKRGHHPMANIRLNLNKDSEIEPGTVVVFDKTETGMSRWIDGKSWSPSRFKGGFFTYRELVDKQPTGLLKKAISVLAPNGHHIHIVAYYTRHLDKSTLASYVAQFPHPDDIYNSANSYRYFKCFRSQSKGWRKPCSYTKSDSSRSSDMGSPEKGMETGFQWPPSPIFETHIQLPSISSLNLSHRIPPSPHTTPYIFNEDAKQLNLIAAFLSI